MLFSHTLNPCGVNSVRCTRVQSDDDDEAEIAFDESREFVDCQCRPVSRSCIGPKKKISTRKVNGVRRFMNPVSCFLSLNENIYRAPSLG